MNFSIALLLLLARTITKYLMAEGDCRGFVARYRLNKIAKILNKINNSCPGVIPYSLNRSLIENKIELVDILGKMVFIQSGRVLKNTTLGVETHDLLGDIKKANNYIDDCLFKLAKSAPDLIVRTNATQRINNQFNLMFLASDKNRAHDIRMEAVRRITHQEFLDDMAADLNEAYDLRFQALKRITDEQILKKVISNNKYDVVLLSVAHERYKNIKRNRRVPK